MRRFFSYIKKHKKAYLLGGAAIVIAGLAVAIWNCSYVQFKRYCKDKELCDCAAQKLSKEEKKAFIAIAKYMKETGNSTLDAGILKHTTAEALTSVGLKIKSCSADVARQVLLSNNLQNRAKFPGDFNCMQQVLMNELSNEEVLFLKSPQSKSLEALKNPVIQKMYLSSSAKLIKCMDEQIQKQYWKEVEKIKEAGRGKKKTKKKASVSKTPAK